jgi:hypothetical protein
MTKRFCLSSLCVPLWTLAAFSAFFSIPGITTAEALSPRNANYTIAVTLDVEKKMLHGIETLVWINTTGDVVRELQFHLYLNAFKNTHSTFIRESGGRLRGDVMTGDGWGWIDVTSMSSQGVKNLRLEFIHPDDDNADDRTVTRVALPVPVPPGQSITIQITFTAQLPKVFARSGYHNDFFLVGQWFPKIGVYETGKGWNCHQYHANSEFFADYGVYDVRITTPERFVVGATGALLEEKKNTDGTKTVTCRAEDVHDFAWTAYPDYVDLKEQWKHVGIRLLLQPEHRGQADRHFHAARAALAYFEKHVGQYPYSTLTIVDPAYGASGAEGMEYPTFITAGTNRFFGTWLRMAEMVVVHEFGHQYFYGMLGSNEFEHPWMDEGINQYMETRIMDETYGAGTSALSALGFTIGDLEFTRAMYVAMRNPKIASLTTAAWKFPGTSYSSLAYGKTAIVLTTLERIIGRAAMDSVLKVYYNRWRFKHPAPEDFVAVVKDVAPRFSEAASPEFLNRFFEQALFGTDVCDYELASIDVKRMEPLKGIIEKNGMEVVAADTAGGKQDGLCTSTVRVSRLGEVQLPVSVLVRFEDGEAAHETWDGLARVMEFRYQRPSRVVWACVDPEEKLVMDVNRINNARSAEAEGGALWKYAVKVLFWVQQLFHWSLLAA